MGVVAGWVLVGAVGATALASTASAGATGGGGERTTPMTSTRSTASAFTPADPAWQWVLSRMGSGTRVATRSTITPRQTYEPGWTGPVDGSFTLRGVPTPPPWPATPLLVDNPPSLSSEYRGVVNGRVTLTPTPNRWLVNVVRLTPTGPVQAGLQGLVQPTGDFSIDLGAATTTAVGDWGLQVLDANNGYRQEGETWPHPGIFQGLVVRALVVTDTTYAVADVPARADGTFHFDDSRPGAKVFQLVDTRTGTVLAEHAPETGLVRSYDVPAGSAAYGRTFTYDQALALITADSIEDHASANRLARGLVALQTSNGTEDGGFVSSAAALNSDAALPEYRSGNQAIATYALLRHLRTLPAGDPSREPVLAAAARGVRWLLAHQADRGPLTGLVTGGRGATRPDGSFDPDVTLPWISTEHNLDTWYTLRLAAAELPGTDAQAADAASHRLDEALVSRLWSPELGRFLQGWQPDGADPTPMLDLTSWGAMWLQRTGRHDLAVQSLAQARVFAATDAGVSGWAPSVPRSDAPLVWFEGSAGVVLAQHRLGESAAAAASLASLTQAQLPTGAWPGATRDDDGSGMSRHPAVAATTWMLLAGLGVAGGPTIWDE